MQNDWGWFIEIEEDNKLKQKNDYNTNDANNDDTNDTNNDDTNDTNNINNDDTNNTNDDDDANAIYIITIGYCVIGIIIILTGICYLII